LETLFLGPHTWEAVYDGLTQLYFSLFTGALTVSLSAWLLVVGVRRLLCGEWTAFLIRMDSEAGAIALFVVVGILLGTLLHPLMIPWGVAHAALFPSVVLLVGLAWTLLAPAERPWTWIVMAGMLAEFFGMFWSHVWLVVEAPDVLDPLLGNLDTKERYHCVFLNDLIGTHDPWSIAATLALQFVFLVVLLTWLRPTPNAA